VTSVKACFEPAVSESRIITPALATDEVLLSCVTTSAMIEQSPLVCC
jgi:hypothetical protein